MASSLLDLARPTQVSTSLSQQSALSSTASLAKPKTRFDDVLARHRPAEPKAPKADNPEPPAKPERAAKSDKPKKADAAKSKHDKHVDEAEPAEDSAEDTTPTEEAEVDEAHANKPAEKSAKTKTTKEARKTGGDGDADTDDADTEADPVDIKKPAATSAELPTDPKIDEVGAFKDGVKKEAAGAGEANNTPTQVDPSALAAQLNAATQQPTENQPATADADANPDAAAEVSTIAPANAQAQTARAQPAAAKPGEQAVDAESELAIKPHAEKGQHAADDQLPTDGEEAAAAIQLPPELEKAESKAPADAKIDPSTLLQAATPQEKTSSHLAALPAVPQADASTPQRTPAEENVDRIVTSVRGEIATKGGTMQIRLDPPSLGAINIQITIDDGVMSASLQTNNDEATRLLSHNLAQLKTQLESTGVTVDRIQVKQATPSEQSSSSNQQGEAGDRQQSRDAGQDQSAGQEQQRREMLQRMWAKLAGNGDPLDLVA